MKRVILFVFLSLFVAGCNNGGGQINSYQPSNADNAKIQHKAEVTLKKEDDKVKTARFYCDILAATKEAEAYDKTINISASQGNVVELAGALRQAKQTAFNTSLKIDKMDIPELVNKEVQDDLKQAAEAMSAYCYEKSEVYEKFMAYADEGKMSNLADLKESRDKADAFCLRGVALMLTAMGKTGMNDKEIQNLMKNK